jgi:16S rRNA C967 or C1407 C5-methylase (RsmB/RsmF family)/NOL1/NOP2/fmu family ribosome biogenesis protein
MQAPLGNNIGAFEQALQTESPVSIRLNKPPKLPIDNMYRYLLAVQWCNNAYYLPERPVFTLDPLFHAGTYYVQEAASMFLEQCINRILNENNGPKTVLDLCAAPGGKSTHLASILPQNSLLLSNEIIRSRANILYENMAKWGAPNCIISNNDPRDFAPFRNFFDSILVDAPCSGEGMFRNDTNAVNEWSEANVKLCAARQRRILADIWGSLKPGGFLIYSTCTYNLEENEKNVRWLMNEFRAISIQLAYPDEWNITPSFLNEVHAVRFFPHKTQSEGLFMTLLQKPDDGKLSVRLRNEKSQYRKLNKDFAYTNKWLKPTQDWSFVQKADSVYALPSNYLTEIDLLNKHLRIVTAGIAIGNIKGKDIIPTAALALSSQIEQFGFVTWDIDIDTALNYLRRNNITTPAGMPKGYILLTYNNIPLGWIKNLGTRSNNLYPQEWRIRHL